MSRRRLVTVFACAALALAGCTSDGKGGASSTAGGSESSAAPGGTGGYYLSVGDSYASGYQPASDGGRGTTSKAGFAYQLVDLAKKRGVDLTLENLGCSGATTTSALTDKGCALGTAGLGPEATPYDAKTQVQAAVDFAKAHRGKITLITVSLGGNDIRPCVGSGSTAAATACVSQRLTTITANVRKIVAQLRAAAGPSAKIVGTGYPDIFLGEALSKNAQRRQLADLSVLAFQSLIVPQLTQAYASAKGTFVDVADATGAYLPASQKTTLKPYGTIPTRVAKVCQLTWYCEYGDIHPRAAGYEVIAQLVAKQL